MTYLGQALLPQYFVMYFTYGVKYIMGQVKYIHKSGGCYMIEIDKETLTEMIKRLTECLTMINDCILSNTKH